MSNRKQFLLLCAAIFLIALGVRFLTWQDNYREIWRIQSSVSDRYKESAGQLLAGDFKTFVSDINHFGHPPGYPILLAAIFKIAGESETAIHVVQILFDAFAVVLLFIIALKLAPFAVAVIAALLAAISPQFAYFPLPVLPDSLIVVPILAAIYFLIRARSQPRLINFFIVGALIGISCWLRANSLLLPLFFAATAALLVQRDKRFRAAATVVAGAVLLIAPITIKNAIVYKRFVPVSLGAGQTLAEGIADYDKTNRFNIPVTDLGLMRQEAEWYGKPEYAQLLFGPDGIERDRMRIARSWAVIRSNPFWFTSVVIRRAINSTRLEPVPVLAPESPVSHDLDGGKTVWTNEGWGFVRGDEKNYGIQRSSSPIDVVKGTDYVFRLPVKLEEGRVELKIMNNDKKVLASQGFDLVEGIPARDQPVRDVVIPFVSASESQIVLVLANNAATNSVVIVGPGRLVELGPSSKQWLRYVRIPLGWLQRIFKTAVFVPLVVIGLFLMARKTDWRTMVILLTVPAYYLIVQSMLHTERRYVYVIHFFFLLPAATTLWSLFTFLRNAKTRNAKR